MAHLPAGLLALVHDPGPMFLVIGDLYVVTVRAVITVPEQQSCGRGEACLRQCIVART